MLPHWPEQRLATPADHAACRELIRTGSRTFFAASLLLPPAVRAPAYALYGFCRLSDDAVDLSNGKAEALDRLRARLDAAYAARPAAVPADRAFAEMVLCYGLPRALPEALLDGFAWDVEGRRYETIDELNAYAARVAGTVGAMMTVLMGECDYPVLARACDLGVAMQLTNIARDVGEDARAGRIYLPLEWMREAGIDPDLWLEDPRFSPELGSVIQRLLDYADVLYLRAASGIARLPRRCRPAIRAACYLYAEIGRELERRGSIRCRAAPSFLPLVRLFSSRVARPADRHRSIWCSHRFRKRASWWKRPLPRQPTRSGTCQCGGVGSASRPNG